MPSPPPIRDQLRAAFTEACAAHEVVATLVDSAGSLQVRFDEQENASPELLDKLFREEFEKTELPLAEVLAADEDLDLEAARRAVGQAIGRLRILLIELNSYLSGHLPWVFPAQPVLADRGLAAYRYPKLAGVDVTAEGDHVRIAFAAGELGKVTSSGFYVPTRIRGDFTVTARYRLLRWEPGEETACFGLFTQDEPSQLRYYSQLRGVGAKYRDLMANFNNAVMTEPVLGAPDEGGFRLQREGRTVRAWHRADDDWRLLGEHHGDPTHDMIIGCKIWSSGTAGALEAALYDLVVDAEIPDDQLPAVPTRPDPRND